MKVLLALIFCLPSLLFADDPTRELFRLNFYPEAHSFVQLGLTHVSRNITTPRSAVEKKEVESFLNIVTLSGAYNFNYFFLGINAAFEAATESAASYGIASDERFTNEAFREPTIFLLTRLREQEGKKGNIDFYASFSDAWGTREIGKSSGNRFNGGNISTIGLSHGYLEDEWEFRNSISYSYFDEGEESNTFTRKHYDLGAYNIFIYKFQGQYQIRPSVFLNAGAGLIYRGTQKILDELENKRKIQAGTGSLIEVGTKKVLSERSVLAITGEFERNSYFVQGEDNFDGRKSEMSFRLEFLQSF